MERSDPHLSVRFAESAQDLRGAERLRYKVFVQELGGDGPLVDHAEALERDALDPFAEHLVLVDDRRDQERLEHVVGVYRMMTEEAAARAGRFYSEAEYDLGPLRNSGRRLLELGRSCLQPEFRGGTAMFQIWQALAGIVVARKIEILFGVASLRGTDPWALAQPLSYLIHAHRAPTDLRVCAIGPTARSLELLPEEKVDRKTAMSAMPALIKAYLRLGGVVGDGAFVDHAFKTTDVCLVLDTTRMSARQLALYGSA